MVMGAVVVTMTSGVCVVAGTGWNVVAGTGWDGAGVRGVTQRLIAVFTDPTHTFSIK